MRKTKFYRDLIYFSLQRLVDSTMIELGNGDGIVTN